MKLNSPPTTNRSLTRKDDNEMGIDSLSPLVPLDIEDCPDLGSLLSSMANTSFGGRNVGKAFLLLKSLVCDTDCRLVLTVSGALTVAKLGNVFGSLISRSMIGAIVTTGAVVTHSLVEELGMAHYAAPSRVSDEELYLNELNRIYDSIEPEANLRRLESLSTAAFSKMEVKSYGSSEIIRHLSSELLGGGQSNGLLASALKHNVKIFVPAFTDSELGLYWFRHSRGQKRADQLVYDATMDLDEYAQWLSTQERIGFLTLGGGVPRNWAQQMIPFLRSVQQDLFNATLPEVVVGVRICPDSATLGHLSGSTYSEAATWGKLPAANQENFVEITSDATVVFPLLAKALIDYRDSI
jgi:deoxyhypusine synthase